CHNIKDISKAAQLIGHIHEEMELHISYCHSYGISEEEIHTTTEDIVCTAYSRFILDIGQSSDFLALQVAMAPCFFGYSEIASWLINDPNTKRQGNDYTKWIDNYVDESYTNSVRARRDLLESKALYAGPNRIEELVDIFTRATRMEKEIWTISLNASRALG